MLVMPFGRETLFCGILILQLSENVIFVGILISRISDLNRQTAKFPCRENFLP